MNRCSQLSWTLRCALLTMLILLSMASCSTKTELTNESELTDFATRYAAAWSGQNPEDLASFYAENGSLSVNDGSPSVGRTAIAATAREYMNAFPDMAVKMDSVSQDGNHATFHWTWTGTNTGPGGTGNAVRISGYEKWTIDSDGLIVESKGHFDEAEYQRQISDDGARSGPSAVTETLGSQEMR